MTNGNYTVFGLKKGDPAWKESLLCDTGSKERYELCLKKAVELGYEITRVYKPDTILSAPDFTKAINVGTISRELKIRGRYFNPLNYGIMTYYRVKKEYDNTCCNGCRFLVKNELYTKKEVEHFGILPNRLEKVEVKKNQTYFLFGARFSNDCSYSS